MPSRSFCEVGESPTLNPFLFLQLLDLLIVPIPNSPQPILLVTNTSTTVTAIDVYAIVSRSQHAVLHQHRSADLAIRYKSLLLDSPSFSNIHILITNISLYPSSIKYHVFYLICYSTRVPTVLPISRWQRFGAATHHCLPYERGYRYLRRWRLATTEGCHMSDCLERDHAIHHRRAVRSRRTHRHRNTCTFR